MSKLLTKFNRNAIDSFLADVGASNNYFVFVGGQTPYPTSDVTLETDNQSVDISTWNELMFGKKANFSRMALKYVWESGTIYTQYDDSIELLDQNFYVVTSSRDVFKCIYNNNGLPSTSEPTKRAGKLGQPVKEDDGYEWLYLYTISKSDYTRFVTANYMPVIANTEVSAAAIDGGLFSVSVVVDGSDYPYHSNTVASVVNTSVFQLASDANNEINIYKDSSISVTNTLTGNTYVRKIFSSNSSLWVTTEAFPSNFLAAGDCEYSIGPTVTITSDTGSGAVAHAIVDSGAVSKIEFVEYGTGYKDANITITSGSGLGSGALARAIISPTGGHGKNVYDELHVDSLGVQCLFDEWGVTNTFNADVTYRTIGLIKNPTYSNGALYTSNTFNQIATINIASGTGSFALGEIVRGNVSNNYGRFAYSNSSVVLLTGTSGTFLKDEELVGDTSLARRPVSANSSAVDLKMYSGEILYIQNIQEVARSNNNNEQAKLVISF